MLLKCGVGEDSFESLGLQDQSILKEISLEYSLEGERDDRRDEMVAWHHQLDGPESEKAPGVGEWTRRPGILQSMGSQRVQHK